MRPIRMTLVLGLAGLLSSCSVSGNRPVAQPAVTTDVEEPPAAMHCSIGELKVSIRLVCGPDGGPIETGSTGLVLITFTNERSAPVRVRTVEYDSGKFAGAKAPAYDASPPFHGIHTLACEYYFVQGGKIFQTGSFEPPDDPMIIAAHAGQEVLRRIRAPEVAGEYDLLIVFCSMPVIRGMGTTSGRVNFPIGSTVNTARANGVRVVPRDE